MACQGRGWTFRQSAPETSWASDGSGKRIKPREKENCRHWKSKCKAMGQGTCRTCVKKGIEASVVGQRKGRAIRRWNEMTGRQTKEGLMGQRKASVFTMNGKGTHDKSREVTQAGAGNQLEDACKDGCLGQAGAGQVMKVVTLQMWQQSWHNLLTTRCPGVADVQVRTQG